MRIVPPFLSGGAGVLPPFLSGAHVRPPTLQTPTTDHPPTQIAEMVLDPTGPPRQRSESNSCCRIAFSSRHVRLGHCQAFAYSTYSCVLGSLALKVLHSRPSSSQTHPASTDCCLPCSACTRCPRRPVHRLPSTACRLLTRQAQRGKSAPATCHVVKGGLVPRKSYVCPPRNFSGQSAIA